MASNPLSGALEIVVRSDPGMMRRYNEDAVFANPALGLVILADGMGGYNAGEVASSMAITGISAALEQDFFLHSPYAIGGAPGDLHVQRCLSRRIAAANTAIYQTSMNQPECAGMGTTLVMAMFHDNAVIAAHLGDSRLYCLRGDEFRQLTHDHSFVQDQVDRGLMTAADARLSRNRGLLTRALGVDAIAAPDLRRHPARPGDIYLLCSDGLNDMLTDREIGKALRAQSENLELAAAQLIQMANDMGGRDNVSVILIKVLREFPVQHTALFRQRRTGEHSRTLFE